MIREACSLFRGSLIPGQMRPRIGKGNAMRRYAILATTLVPALSWALTFQDFDSPGTPYMLQQHFGPPGTTILSGGRTGKFLRLATGGAYQTVNTISLELTDPGSFPRVHVEFDFRMLGSADGIGFALLDTSFWGDSGPVGEIQEGALIEGSLVLGLDIFQNPETGDPSHNFVKVTYDATVVAVADPGFPLANGAWHHADLELEATSGGGLVTLVLSPAGGTPVTPFSELLVPGFAPYEARAAFGGRTGALTADHDIDNVTVRFVPEPETGLLVGAGLLSIGLGTCRRRRSTA